MSINSWGGRGTLIINAIKMASRVDADAIQFKHPFSMILSGNRRTGKTHFTKTLILRNRELIAPPIDRVFWFYASHQADVFSEIDANAAGAELAIEYAKGLPSDDIMETVDARSGKKLIIIDDLMEEASNRSDVSNLFTKGRHSDVSVIFLTQNLFHKGKYSREISLNTDYMVNFKNPRDSSIITNLGRQMGNTKFLQDVYRDATKEAYSHLLIDMRADTDNRLRYRSNVLQDTQRVYQPDWRARRSTV